MSRNLLDETYYISHGGVVPIKWTAPEVIVVQLPTIVIGTVFLN